MAATIGNAIKALVEGAGVGLSAYRDVAPADQELPYVTIIEAIATIPNGAPDGGAEADCTEQVQVDLWERWKDDDGQVVESIDLALDLVRLLHGAQIETPMRTHGISVVNRRRLIETGRNVVHTAITANVHRAL